MSRAKKATFRNKTLSVLNRTKRGGNWLSQQNLTAKSKCCPQVRLEPRETRDRLNGEIEQTSFARRSATFTSQTRVISSGGVREASFGRSSKLSLFSAQIEWEILKDWEHFSLPRSAIFAALFSKSEVGWIARSLCSSRGQQIAKLCAMAPSKGSEGEARIFLQVQSAPLGVRS